MITDELVEEIAERRKKSVRVKGYLYDVEIDTDCMRVTMYPRGGGEIARCNNTSSVSYRFGDRHYRAACELCDAVLEYLEEKYENLSDV